MSNWSKNLSREASQQSVKVGEQSGRSMAGGIAKTLKWGAIGATAGLGALAATAGKKGLDRLMGIEDARASLAGLGHDSKSVDAIMENALNSVRGTAFGMADAGKVAASAVAAGIKPGRDLENNLKLVADAATIAGTDMGSMGGIFNKVASSNKIQGDTIAQLNDAGIPIVQLMARELGTTAEETVKLASAGKVDFKTFSSAMQEGLGGAALKSGETLRGSLANTGAALGRIGANFLSGIYPKLAPAFQRLTGFMEPLEEKSAAVGQAIGAWAATDGKAILMGVVGAAKALWPVLKGIVTTAIDIVKWFNEHRGVALGLAAAIGSLVVITRIHATVMAVQAAGGLLAMFRATRVVTAATKVYTAVQWLANAALRAFPAVLIVTLIAAFVAALVIAYKKSDTFREIVQRAWAGIQKAVSVAWSNYIKPALVALAAFVTGTLIPVIKRLWTNTIRPAFAAIGRAIAWTWSKVIQPALRALWAFTKNVLMPVIRFLWKNVVVPAFKGIGHAIRVAWGIIKIIFAAWKKYFQAVLFPVIRFLWDKVVKPVFSGLAATIKRNWNNVVKPVLTALGNFINDQVRPKFKRGVDAIKSIWEGIKAAFKAPIRFVIETVINKGLIGGFNWIAKRVGAGDINPVPMPFKRGGVLPGYTPGRDVHHFASPTGGRLHLSGGEAIMRPEWTRAVGGPRAVEAMNRQARTGKMHGPLRDPDRRFFLGGVMPMVGATSVSRHSGYPWAQWAGDLNGIGDDTGKAAVAWKPGTVASVQSIAGSYGNYIRVNHAGQQSLYAHLSRFNSSPGQRVGAGQKIGEVGSTGNSSGPHLHFEVKGGNVSGFAGVSTSGSAQAQPRMPAWASKFLGGPLEWLRDKISGGLSALTDRFGGNAVVSLAKAIPNKLVSSAADFLKTKVSGKFAGSLNGNVTSLGGLSGPVKDQVRAVAQQFGWGSSPQWPAIVELVQRESSWNPAAANPTSSARGLFQKMTSIHGPIEPTAAGQAQWGLNYIRNRYGSPTAALGFHDRNNWYAQGGVLPGVYDRGGWLEPGQAAVNRSKSPEPVFNERQWSTLRQLTMSGATAARGGGPGALALDINVFGRFEQDTGYIEEVSYDVYQRQSSADRDHAGRLG